MKFRLADQIVEWETQSTITGLKAVSFEEYCLRSPLGYPEAIPESLIVESFFQFAAWLVILSSDFSNFALTSEVDEISFSGPAKPGDCLLIKVRIRDYRLNSILFDASGACGTREIASAKGCSSQILPLSSFFDPEDMKTLFSEIWKSPGEKMP